MEVNGYYEDRDNFCIRSCGASEIDRVMDYYKKTLGDDHILGTDKTFVDWQYFNKKRINYNFLCLTDKQSNTILGVVGYIPNSHYDDLITPENDFIWIVNWSVLETAPGGSGLKLLSSVSKYEECKNLGSTGVADSAISFYRLFKYKADRLRHYCMVSGSADTFRLVKNYKKNKKKTFPQNCCRFEPFSENEKIFVFDYHKTERYFINKYIRHPYYKYYLYKIIKDGKPCGLAVFRISEHNGGRLLRHIDFCGDIAYLDGMYDELQRLMDRHSAEALEYYCFGIDLTDYGFVDVEKADDLIVPYHFEPYAEKNAAIAYVYKNETPALVFKGDGDRERPGRINVSRETFS